MTSRVLTYLVRDMVLPSPVWRLLVALRASPFHRTQPSSRGQVACRG